MNEEKKNPELELEAVDDSDLQDVAGGLFGYNFNDDSGTVVIDLENGGSLDLSKSTSSSIDVTAEFKLGVKR